MKLAWEDLLSLSDPEARIAQRFGSEEQCLAALMASLPNPDSFLAGGLQRNHPVLEEYFSLTGNSSRDAKTVLAMLQGGIKLTCTPASSPCQLLIPDFAKKRAVVQQMLARARSPYTSSQLLGADAPMQVHFPNHLSASRYAEFVSTEITSMLAKDVIKVSRSGTAATLLPENTSQTGAMPDLKGRQGNRPGWPRGGA